MEKRVHLEYENANGHVAIFSDFDLRKNKREVFLTWGPAGSEPSGEFLGYTTETGNDVSRVYLKHFLRAVDAINSGTQLKKIQQ
jgi:hypothetical protein